MLVWADVFGSMIETCTQIPDATDDAVAALASIPSPRNDVKPASASTTSSPTGRASVASSARATRAVAFALPGAHDGAADGHASEDALHEAIALEVEESVCGTEAGTLDSIRRWLVSWRSRLLFLTTSSTVCVARARWALSIRCCLTRLPLPAARAFRRSQKTQKTRRA